MPTPSREIYLTRLTALRDERSTWIQHWQELSDWIYPRRFRYLQTDRNKGTKRNDKIINNKPTISVRVLQAGMMAGLTSPARPWFRLTSSDPLLLSDSEVMGWMSLVERAVLETFAKSNLYNGLHEMYGIQATFATAVMYVEEDDEDDVRAYVIPIGQFCLAASKRQRVDTIYREFSMTVGQLVKKFGKANCSPNVQLLYDKRSYDTWIDIVHVVEPSDDYDEKIGQFPFRSCWFEKAAPTDHGFLREHGYEEFPYIVMRWYVTGEDIYGSGSPGMDSLGDCKALQILERRKAQAIDKIATPPMAVPVSMKSQKLSLLPGDTTYVPDGLREQVRPLIEVNPQAVPNTEASIQRHEQRIGDTFFVNLFIMMLNDDRQQPSTAREINERHEEKMLQVGPVVERNEDEGLDPLINRVARILARKGKIPPPPQKLLNRRVKIEYVSIMAQAQKLLGTSATERLVSFVGSVSAVKPDALDLLNYDAIITEYARMLGVPPDSLNKAEIVAQVRQAKAAQMQQAQQMAMQTQGAEQAKVASETDLTGDTALSRLINTVGGGQGPI
jgi:hypothetical protein